MVAEYGSLDGAPGVEPRAVVADRAAAVLAAQTGLLDDADVVLVSHDAVIRILLDRLGHSGKGSVPTGSWTILTRRQGGGWRIERIGIRPPS